MRLVIEVTEAERDAIRKFCVERGTTYSALIRSLLRLAKDGKVKVPRPDATGREAAPAVAADWVDTLYKNAGVKRPTGHRGWEPRRKR